MVAQALRAERIVEKLRSYGIDFAGADAVDGVGQRPDYPTVPDMLEDLKIGQDMYVHFRSASLGELVGWVLLIPSNGTEDMVADYSIGDQYFAEKVSEVLS
jgi:hypothetical protein